MDPVTILASALLISDTHLQNGCNDYDVMENVLASDYGERPVVNMKDRDGGSLVLYVNPDTLTWTLILVNYTKNTSCIVDTGNKINRVFKGKKQDM